MKLRYVLLRYNFNKQQRQHHNDQRLDDFVCLGQYHAGPG